MRASEYSLSGSHFSVSSVLPQSMPNQLQPPKAAEKKTIASVATSGAIQFFQCVFIEGITVFGLLGSISFDDVHPAPHRCSRRRRRARCVAVADAADRRPIRGGTVGQDTRAPDSGHIAEQ